MAPPSVTHLASEHARFGHTGGLGEVVADLSAAQAALGSRVRVVLPVHSRHAADIRPGPEVHMPWGAIGFGRSDLTIDGVEVVLLTNPGLFDRPHLYGPPGGRYDDNHVRYAAYCRAATAICRTEPTDVVHGHDWHTGLAMALVAQMAPRPRLVFTVHNAAHQGAFPSEDMPITGLGWEHFGYDGILHGGYANALKAGLQFADTITTVSPTHAWELTTELGGFGLDGVFRWRRRDLVGVLNGIRTDEPAPDPAGFPGRRAALCADLGLEVPRGPLIGFVGRLTSQKGVDALLGVIPWAVSQGCAFAILASGEPHLAQALRDAQHRHAGRVCFYDGFKPELADRIFAGTDIVAVPSRFEPCGLVQMHAMRAGTIPVVRCTGGLADTVVDADANGWGFVYHDPTPEGLAGALRRALAWYARPERWAELRTAARSRDFSWARPARRYLELYQEEA